MICTFESVVPMYEAVYKVHFCSYFVMSEARVIQRLSRRTPVAHRRSKIQNVDACTLEACGYAVDVSVDIDVLMPRDRPTLLVFLAALS